MNFGSIIIACIYLSILISCVPKSTTIYYDESGKEISLKQYRQIEDVQYNLIEEVKTDSSNLIRLRTRQFFGKFENDEFRRIQKLITESLNCEINFQKDVLIGYFIEENNDKNSVTYYLDKRNSKYEYWDKYLRVTIKAYNSENEMYPYYVDKEKVIEEIFLPEFQTSNNWIVIRPDGTYRIYLAEGGYYIFEELDKEWNKEYIKSEINQRIRSR